jgi:hypothetical protein
VAPTREHCLLDCADADSEPTCECQPPPPPQETTVAPSFIYELSSYFIYIPDRKELIKIISATYLLISLITTKYLVDMILINPFRSGYKNAYKK